MLDNFLIKLNFLKSVFLKFGLYYINFPAIFNKKVELNYSLVLLQKHQYLEEIETVLHTEGSPCTIHQVLGAEIMFKSAWTEHRGYHA